MNKLWLSQEERRLCQLDVEEVRDAARANIVWRNNMDRPKSFTNCSNVQSATKRLIKSEDRELVDDAAIAFVKCFVKRYFDSKEDTASIRIFEALCMKGASSICEKLTGVDLKQIMMDAGITV